MQFELPRRHRKSFEVTTKKKLSEKFNKSQSIEMFEIIKTAYKNSTPTFGSSTGQRESTRELHSITRHQIENEYTDCDVAMNQSITEIKKVKTS